MSSNQFQNTRAFFYAIGMSDGPLRSYIINSTKFLACLYGLDYPDEDSIITSQLCREVDEIERYINGITCDDCFTDNAYCVMAFGNHGLTCERCKSRGNGEGCLGDDCSIPEMDFLPVKSQRDYVKTTRYAHYLIEIVIPSLVKHICMVGSLESLQMNNIIDSDFNHDDFKKWADDITSLLRRLPHKDKLEVFWRNLSKNNMALSPQPPSTQTTSSAWGNYSKMELELFRIRYDQTEMIDNWRKPLLEWKVVWSRSDYDV
ncbi:hypothetical protein BDQ17DRAFT_1426022 [Cyathus striatus]|nr:hypothetical protein BDQ17DRAFT_1426022 [Cyathus striatus]